MTEAFRQQTWAKYWRAMRLDAWLSFQEWLGNPARLLAWSEDFPAAESMRQVSPRGINSDIGQYSHFRAVAKVNSEDGLVTHPAVIEDAK